LETVSLLFNDDSERGLAIMADEKKLSDVSWKDFKALALRDKGAYFQAVPQHTLIAQQFSREQLEQLCTLATRIKRINKRRDGANFLKGLLSDKRAMLYFAQPSSRTYLSFNAACQILGLDTMDVRDSKTSSEVKGESPEDTIRTFSSYVDMIIMRHPVGGFAERVAWMLAHTNREIPVLNAGSGADQHPTQALLDIYTLERSFEDIGGIDGKHVAFVGDLMRGRTVRSLAWLLTLYRDMTLYFVAPEPLQVGQDILDLLDQAGTKYVVTQDFTSVMPLVDAIYMTRIQDEWDVDGESSTIDTTAFSIGAEHMDIIKQSAVIMHPLPRREEVSTDIDNEPRAIYWRQMRNGMWIRAALILSTFGRQDEVNQYYDDYKPDA
jgi:aspartate carbamoyltransferase catalytic subunit